MSDLQVNETCLFLRLLEIRHYINRKKKQGPQMELILRGGLKRRVSGGVEHSAVSAAVRNRRIQMCPCLFSCSEQPHQPPRVLKLRSTNDAIIVRAPQAVTKCALQATDLEQRSYMRSTQPTIHCVKKKKGKKKHTRKHKRIYAIWHTPNVTIGSLRKLSKWIYGNIKGTWRLKMLPNFAGWWVRWPKWRWEQPPIIKQASFSFFLNPFAQWWKTVANKVTRHMSQKNSTNHQKWIAKKRRGD